MIEARGLTKRYGAKIAVNNLSFRLQPGVVTGFLGPNGAGKSTTMRMIMGLDRPTAGQALIGGRPYGGLASPLTTVGALLEAKAIHPGRSARNHLRILAATHGIPNRRVDEVIDLTGISSVATKRVGGFSLGMGQRLGIAVALLGDPQALVLDEPVNGLDPEGVAWIRQLVRYLAGEGRTILISSHLMSEMAQTADHLIIVGQGRLLADAPIDQFLADASGTATRVRSPQAAEIAQVLAGQSVQVTPNGSDLLLVEGLDGRQVGELAAQRGWVLHELTPIKSSLEDAYLRLTESSVEYRTGAQPQQYQETHQ